MKHDSAIIVWGIVLTLNRKKWGMLMTLNGQKTGNAGDPNGLNPGNGGGPGQSRLRVFADEFL